ncbi:hypothetical protein M5K25_004363 [Dendrobium thyrsiflorum]|uniref:Cyclin N-terminal domain-containing protein n=1 Tax=Dendrobium thyrsiflorum TaxID=117978 RepID=A0ABD0VME6_DENTH
MLFCRSMDLSTSYSLYCAEDAESWDAGGDDFGDEWAPAAFDLMALLAAETEHIPCSDYLSRSLDSVTARHDSINWMLKVIDFYRFRPETAYLSVNYLDRFLSVNSLPVVKEQNGWPIQLLSVACISVAAKMEETHVPLLLDLQVLDPRYLFEPRTIRRMELVLMAALHWRMRSITPFDFLPHFASVVLPCVSASRPALFSRAADLIISTLPVLDFIKFRPSAVAGAAVLCAAAELSDSTPTDNGDCLSCLSGWLSKDVLGACRRLMDQYLIDRSPSPRAKPPIRPPTPRSPVGVLDTAHCGSCDTQKSSAAGMINGDSPPLKRRRLVDSQCTESI